MVATRIESPPEARQPQPFRMSLSAGTRLGPYEIVAAVGAGGMGEVYRARDTRLEREVAVKVLSRDLTSSQIARERFQREARTIAALHHPHICAIYDVGETPEHQAFIVMEFLQGETLEERLRKGPLDAPGFAGDRDCPGRRARCGACRRNRSSRHQTGECLSDGMGPEAARLRRRQDGAASRWCELRHPNGRRTADVDRRRGRGRHARVHVAGAAARRRGRRTNGRVLARACPLPDGNRTSRLRRGDWRRRRGRNPSRAATSALDAAFRADGPVRRDHPEGARKRSDVALRECGRSHEPTCSG